jgi:uncharacterized protein with HEPN domain
LRPETRKYLLDALAAADLIVQFVASKSFEAYCQDAMLRSAVERQFLIIGEALAQMAKYDSETAAKIPDLPRIVAFRNFVIHAYATVDDKVVWGIVEARLLPLRELLQTFLQPSP